MSQNKYNFLLTSCKTITNSCSLPYKDSNECGKFKMNLQNSDHAARGCGYNSRAVTHLRSDVFLPRGLSSIEVSSSKSREVRETLDQH